MCLYFLYFFTHLKQCQLYSKKRRKGASINILKPTHYIFICSLLGEAFAGTEKFLTSAYKKQLLEMREYESSQKEKEAKEAKVRLLLPLPL